MYETLGIRWLEVTRRPAESRRIRGAVSPIPSARSLIRSFKCGGSWLWMLVAYVLSSAVILCSASVDVLTVWMHCHLRGKVIQEANANIICDTWRSGGGVRTTVTTNVTPYSLQIHINIWQRNTSESRSKTSLPNYTVSRVQIYFRHSDMRSYRVNSRTGTSLFQKKLCNLPCSAIVTFCMILTTSICDFCERD